MKPQEFNGKVAQAVEAPRQEFAVGACHQPGPCYIAAVEAIWIRDYV